MNHFNEVQAMKELLKVGSLPIGMTHTEAFMIDAYATQLHQNKKPLTPKQIEDVREVYERVFEIE